MIVSGANQFRRVFRSLGRHILALLAWDLLVVVTVKVLGWEWIASRDIPLALYGSTIGIVVGFRNNSAYSRWWEARTVWGQIVNSSRNLGRQVCASLSASPEISTMQRKIVYHQIAFVHALRQQLRGMDPVPAIQSFVSSDELAQFVREKNLPLAVQTRMAAVLRDARNLGWINDWEWQSIDRTLSDLMASQGAAERIKNTPLPKQYDFFLILFVLIYCLLLPIGMVSALGWFTPLGSTLVGFMFLALDRIGRNLEDPFENSANDLPLTAIAKTIEINLLQILGDTVLPEPEAARDGVLW
jgi:ion channel-forming bestrophin family protein